MGRVSRTGRARERRRRAGQLVEPRGAEHVPDAREELRQLRQLAADQDGSDRRGLQRRDRARHVNGQLSEGSGQNLFLVRDNVILHAAADRRRSCRASRATRSSRWRAISASRCGKRCCRARCSTSATRRSSSGPRRKSRRFARSTRSRSATAAAARSPKRIQTAFFDVINGEAPDRHGWLTYVYPGEPLQPRRSRRAGALRQPQHAAKSRAEPVAEPLAAAEPSCTSTISSRPPSPAVRPTCT